MQIEGIISGLREAAKRYGDKELNALANEAESALLNVEMALDDAFDAGKASTRDDFVYALTLKFERYVKFAEDDWRTVEAKRDFVYHDWDDIQNVVGYLADGADGDLSFTIEKRRNK